MKNKAIDVRAHAFAACDRILVDTNVWTYLFCPVPQAAWAVNAYSHAFKAWLNAGATFFLDVLVFSEFVNTFARLEWKASGVALDFKAFRQAPAFQSVAATIGSQAANILSVSKQVPHAFDEWNLKILLAEFSAGKRDVNDQLLIETCRKFNLSLVTNDADFTEGGVRVFTANQRLLAACP